MCCVASTFSISLPSRVTRGSNPFEALTDSTVIIAGRLQGNRCPLNRGVLVGYGG